VKPIRLCQLLVWKHCLLLLFQYSAQGKLPRFIKGLRPTLTSLWFSLLEMSLLSPQNPRLDLRLPARGLTLILNACDFSSKSRKPVKAREEQARYVKCDTLSVTKSGSILLDAILLKSQPTALFDLRGGASHYFHLRMQIPSERVGFIGTNSSGVMGMCTLAVYLFCIVTGHKF